jgi:hypothetical protein
MFSGGFTRSSRYGLIGVLVVMALTAAIALTMGSGEANPKLTLGLIFSVLAIFLVGLFALQRSDLERVAACDAAATQRAAAEGGRPLENPTAPGEGDLWAALAIAPIDRDAIQAREEMWGGGRRSINLGIVIVVLIFLTVPPMYLLESLVPLYVGAPLIVLTAIYGAFRAVGPGGELDQGYELTDRAMKPLGLQLTARPKGGLEPRGPTMPGFDYRLRGLTELSGERHGRRVTIRFGGHEEAGTSEVTIAGPARPYEAKSKRVTVSSGPAGISITRRKSRPGDWLSDLWLAERLASD